MENPKEDFEMEEESKSLETEITQSEQSEQYYGTYQFFNLTNHYKPHKEQTPLNQRMLSKKNSCASTSKHATIEVIEIDDDDDDNDDCSYILNFQNIGQEIERSKNENKRKNCKLMNKNPNVKLEKRRKNKNLSEIKNDMIIIISSDSDNEEESENRNVPADKLKILDGISKNRKGKIFPTDTRKDKGLICEEMKAENVRVHSTETKIKAKSEVSKDTVLGPIFGFKDNSVCTEADSLVKYNEDEMSDDSDTMDGQLIIDEELIEDDKFINQNDLIIEEIVIENEGDFESDNLTAEEIQVLHRGEKENTTESDSVENKKPDTDKQHTTKPEIFVKNEGAVHTEEKGHTTKSDSVVNYKADVHRKEQENITKLGSVSNFKVEEIENTNTPKSVAIKQAHVCSVEHVNTTNSASIANFKAIVHGDEIERATTPESAANNQVDIYRKEKGDSTKSDSVVNYKVDIHREEKGNNNKLDSIANCKAEEYGDEIESTSVLGIAEENQDDIHRKGKRDSTKSDCADNNQTDISRKEQWTTTKVASVSNYKVNEHGDEIESTTIANSAANNEASIHLKEKGDKTKSENVANCTVDEHRDKRGSTNYDAEMHGDDVERTHVPHSIANNQATVHREEQGNVANYNSDVHGDKIECTAENNQAHVGNVEQGKYFDQTSRDGHFSFQDIGCDKCPTIYRYFGHYVPVRTLENHLGHYVALFSKLIDSPFIESHYMSEAEAKLLTEITRNTFCCSTCSNEPFNTNDLLIRYTDANEFFIFVNSCMCKIFFQATYEYSRNGLMKILWPNSKKFSIVAYVRYKGQAYIPLFFFDSTSRNELFKNHSVELKGWDLQYLLFCLRVSNMAKYDAKEVQCVPLKVILSLLPEDTIVKDYWDIDNNQFKLNETERKEDFFHGKWTKIVPYKPDEQDLHFYDDSNPNIPQLRPIINEQE